MDSDLRFEYVGKRGGGAVGRACPAHTCPQKTARGIHVGHKRLAMGVAAVLRCTNAIPQCLDLIATTRESVQLVLQLCLRRSKLGHTGFSALDVVADLLLHLGAVGSEVTCTGISYTPLDVLVAMVRGSAAHVSCRNVGDELYEKRL